MGNSIICDIFQITRQPRRIIKTKHIVCQGLSFAVELMLEYSSWKLKFQKQLETNKNDRLPSTLGKLWTILKHSGALLSIWAGFALEDISFLDALFSPEKNFYFAKSETKWPNFYNFYVKFGN